MDIKKMLQWIGNIEYADGGKLSYGSTRTLCDLKKELRNCQPKEQSELLLCPVCKSDRVTSICINCAHKWGYNEK